MAKFNEMRRAFVYHNGWLSVQKEGDNRYCKDWAEVELQMSKEEWAFAIRGYIMKGQICFFTGEDYRPDPRVTDELIAGAQKVHRESYGEDCTAIYNGVTPGTPGEVWKPILKMTDRATYWWPV